MVNKNCLYIKGCSDNSREMNIEGIFRLGVVEIVVCTLSIVSETEGAGYESRVRNLEFAMLTSLLLRPSSDSKFPVVV